MIERCPRCRQLLLTLNWSALKRCEACKGYVEPDGTWIEGREGDIRYAEVMTREHAMTVAELAKALPADSETHAEDLSELCHRHRRTHRAAFDRRCDDFLTETPLDSGGGGYRERPSTAGVRLTLRSTGVVITARRLAIALAVGIPALFLGFVLPSTWSAIKVPLFFIGLLLVMFPVGLSILAGLGHLIERVWPQTRRTTVRAIEHRGRAEPVVVHTSAQRHQLPATSIHLAIVRTYDASSRSPSFVAYLHGPGSRAELARDARREPVRRLVLRLEHVLDLRTAAAD